VQEEKRNTPGKPDHNDSRETQSGSQPFLCGHDGRLFFFSKRDSRLFALTGRSFAALVARDCEFPFTNVKARRVIDPFSSLARQLPPTTPIHTIAAYDAQTSTLAVSDGGGSILLHERGKEWKRVANGTRGLYFLIDPDAEPCEVEFKREKGTHLSWFLEQFPLSAYRGVDAWNQRMLLLEVMLSWFFLGPHRRKLVPLFLGPSGSGKSTSLKLFGHLLIGPRFEPCGVETRQIFVDNITSRALYALDNVDSTPSWLEEAIAGYAAGRRQRLRGSYATNDLAAYAPTAILLMASHAPRITRPDVAQRLVPFYLERPTGFVREQLLFGELARRRGAILGELLSNLARISDRVAQQGQRTVAFQDADFASFVMDTNEDPWLAKHVLKNLEGARADLCMDRDGFAETFRQLVLREDIVNMAIAELFERCTKIAAEKHLIIPRTVQGFGQRLTNLRPALERELNIDIKTQRLHANRRVVTITRRAATHGSTVIPQGEVGG
jgi:hypothetical protein